ncbi:hypothetical protein MNV49_003078 [Pseudohyphozyma bogoriensis]|nr:hypothetical protein MNV49_003078 [Pseudohyphozyma bogoriensis]
MAPSATTPATRRVRQTTLDKYLPSGKPHSSPSPHTKTSTKSTPAPATRSHKKKAPPPTREPSVERIAGQQHQVRLVSTESSADDHVRSLQEDQVQLRLAQEKHELMQRLAAHGVALPRETLVERLGQNSADEAIAAAAVDAPDSTPTIPFGQVYPAFTSPPFDAFDMASRTPAGSTTTSPTSTHLHLSAWLNSPDLTDEEEPSEPRSPASAREQQDDELKEEQESSPMVIRAGGKTIQILCQLKRQREEEEQAGDEGLARVAGGLAHSSDDEDDDRVLHRASKWAKLDRPCTPVMDRREPIFDHSSFTPHHKSHFNGADDVALAPAAFASPSRGREFSAAEHDEWRCSTPSRSGASSAGLHLAWDEITPQTPSRSSRLRTPSNSDFTSFFHSDSMLHHHPGHHHGIHHHAHDHLSMASPYGAPFSTPTRHGNHYRKSSYSSASVFDAPLFA